MGVMKISLLPGNVDPTEALIYLWEIKDRSTGRVVYRYVGKAKEGAGRPLSDYKRNVRNLRAGRPYRKGKPEFRRIHRRLARAEGEVREPDHGTHPAPRIIRL